MRQRFDILAPAVHRVRSLTLGTVLVLALGLAAGGPGAEARTAAAANSSSRAGERATAKAVSHPFHASRGKRGTARRSAALRRRQTRKAKPTTEPAPESAPVPAPESGPTAAPGPETEPDEPEPVPTPAPEPSGTLFNGDFDAGFTGWYVQSLSERATLFSSGAFEGAQAARFEVRDGDVEPDTGSERSEVSGPDFFEGQDLYIRDAIRVPGANTYQGPWQIVQQLHENSWSGSPGIAVFLDANRVLQLGAGDGSPTYWRGPALEPDRWYELIYRVKLSRDASAGFVEVWLDGAPQTLLNGQGRAYGQTIQAASTYLKAGIYRSKSSTGTSLVEHDAIVVGSSLTAVSRD